MDSGFETDDGSRLHQIEKYKIMNEIQFILYQLTDEEGKVQVIIKDETIWATQKAMAQLFGVGVPAISKHLAHIFEEKELDADMVVSKMEITTPYHALKHPIGTT